MKEIMKHKLNPLTNDWLCWIPETSQAYYMKNKKVAKDFCEKVNASFAKGELKIIDGVVTPIKK